MPRVVVEVMPKPEILDPQGKAVHGALPRLGFDGILDVRGKVIPELDAAELEQIAEKGIVHGGMLAKVQTVIHALRHGVTDVHILNAKRPHGLIEELFTEGGVGTICRLRSRAKGANNE